MTSCELHLPTMRRSASTGRSASCVDTATVAPARLAAVIQPTTAAQVPGSWPTVGSSSSMTPGRCASAAASASRRCSPPESRYGLAPPRWPSPNTSSTASTSTSRPTLRPVLATSSATVRGEESVLGILRHPPDRLGEPRRTPAADVRRDGARRRLEQSAEHRDRGRLAGTTRAGERRDRARLERRRESRAAPSYVACRAAYG